MGCCGACWYFFPMTTLLGPQHRMLKMLSTRAQTVDRRALQCYVAPSGENHQGKLRTSFSNRLPTQFARTPQEHQPRKRVAQALTTTRSTISPKLEGSESSWTHHQRGEITNDLTNMGPHEREQTSAPWNKTILLLDRLLR